MGDFALILGLEETAGGIFTKRGGMRKVNLYANLNAYIIELPFRLDELLHFKKNKVTRVKKYIDRVCNENNIGSRIFQKELINSAFTEGQTRSLFDGKCLYKSLLASILDRIYTSRGIKISDLNIVVVHGGNLEELSAIITLLLPMARYITVISNNKEEAETEVERIYIDTGLSVGLSSDCKNILKDADLIIDLGHFNKSARNYRIYPKTITLDFHGIKASALSGGNILIKGIEIELNDYITNKIYADMDRYYNKLEIAEIILVHKLDYEKKIIRDSFNYLLMDNISKEFIKDGYTITGFLGRHGVISVEQIPSS